MIYRIRRTSDSWDNIKPCSKAFRKESSDDPRYYIEINSLEELHELMTEVDCGVIFHDDSIEIYDDWRE